MQTAADRRAWVRGHLEESATVKLAVARTLVPDILAAADLLTATFRGGGKVLLCGNGGSAADCQHVAAELVHRLSKDFERPGLAAIALTTDTSLLTGFANDVDFAGVFERQVRALGRPGDLLVGISTSGSSTNVVRAVRAARALGLRTLVLTSLGGHLHDLADVAIAVPSHDTQHIQEAHLSIEHVLCYVVERDLFADPGGTNS
jgi:D-sedoheptulose 7-phosphate isomerase